MNWKELTQKLNFEFSDVVNCFDLNFGWNLNAKITRYAKRGALIELHCGSQKMDVVSSPVPELMEFRRQHLKDEDYMTLVYPTGNKIEIFKQKKGVKKIILPQISILETNYWIITGSESNLKIGVDHGLWGVKKDFEDVWNNVKKDDLLFFYCTFPISGIVGCGKVIDKQINIKPFWPNENSKKESKYPLRILFETIFVMGDWKKERKSLSRTGISYYHGLNYIDPDKREYLSKIIK